MAVNNSIWLLLAIVLFAKNNASTTNSTDLHHRTDNSSALALNRTRTFALFLSTIQCFPESTSGLDSESVHLIETHQTFDPNAHLSEYVNQTEVKTLIEIVNNYTTNNIPIDQPFTNAPDSILEFQRILIVLYRNAGNWNLFYNTTAWLLGRVNIGRLLWALIVVAAEKYTDTVIFPSIPETIPQLYIPKQWTAPGSVAPSPGYISENPMYYWTTDPGLNEFHLHFHQDQPYWWDDEFYGVVRPRRGEMFMFMHHEVVNRYNAERLSHGLAEVIPLELYPDYKIPEGYEAEIVNFDFAEFQSRPDNWRIGAFDNDNTVQLSELSLWRDRIIQGIQNGYFIGKNGEKVSLMGENGTDIFGNTAESSNVYSVNKEYYGALHNILHQYVSGVLRRKQTIPPGVQAHQETAMRDRLFYQLHKLIDNLYIDFKRKLTKPYPKDELKFDKVSILSVRLYTKPQQTQLLASNPLHPYYPTLWPFYSQYLSKPTLTTFMTERKYNINNAVRPCRSINDDAKIATVVGIDHDPYTISIAVSSTRSEVSYGMVRIFLWPDAFQNGTKLEGDAAHERAIQLDIFHVRLLPNRLTIINRSSQDSAFTRPEPTPGIKQLYNATEAANLLRSKDLYRACGFPNNMLLPRGTSEGLKFKLTVMISDETDQGYVNDNNYPRFPMCGTLNGKRFPDKRSMGFPFDRPGTKLNSFHGQFPTVQFPQLLSNFKQIDVTIKHSLAN